MNSFNDTIQIIAEDVNNLLIRLDSIKSKLENVSNMNFIQLKIKGTLEKQFNNSIAEFFLLENILQDILQCNSDEDLKYMFDDSEE